MPPKFNQQTVLALDIGGANIKACYRDSSDAWQAMSQRFVMCQQVDDLTVALQRLLNTVPLPVSHWLVTMTGELCDCFLHRSQGVQRILDAVHSVACNIPVSVWSTSGHFVTIAQAMNQTQSVASANWHALATWVAINHSDERLLLLDTGSTTTDLIPILNGHVATEGLTDAIRLEHGQLIYVGGTLTPLMVFSEYGMPLMNEWFANMQDMAVVLGFTLPQPAYCDTPDGQPLTEAACAQRVMRMFGKDFSDMQTTRLFARRLLEVAIKRLADVFQQQIQRHAPLDRLVISGSGSWLIKEALTQLHHKIPMTFLDQHWAPQLSTAACAVAVAKLDEHWRVRQ